ncbi:MAG: DnaJ domain-containing protein [Desulfobacterales bacterium]|nr:DnaJ domain-containing protein [Desulfobacterales bacterium]
MWKIILIVSAALYALWPYDFLPDLLIGWGWLDDLIILGLLWRYLKNQKIKPTTFRQYSKDEAFNRNTSDRQFRSKQQNATDNPYTILGINPNASPEDIKKAYRQLAGKYHPDKVAHLGEEFKELAEKRFKEIQKAYQKLMPK